MSMYTNWLNDLALLPDIHLSHWQPLQHQRQSTTLQADQLAQALATLGPVSGWLLEPSAVTQLDQQVLDGKHYPVSAELFTAPDADGLQRCWQLTHLGRGQWQLHSHQIHPVPADQANCLGQRVQQRHVHAAATRLLYWKLWHADPDSRAPQCTTAVLAAIEGSRP